jgi:hypothetical protein
VARLTDRDQELLAFMAEHRFVLAGHVQSLLGISPSAAAARLRALSAAGFIASRRIFHHQPAAHQITRKGLRTIASSLPVPRIDLRCYQHDIDLAWLWLVAHGGAFGPLRSAVSERQMRSTDAVVARSGAPLGVRLGGVGPHGVERLHYPDLMLLAPGGQRIAVELELSAKGRTRRERILAGYGADARIDAVLYLVKDAALARSIQASARRLGISPRVHVQWARSGGGVAGSSRVPGRVSARAPASEAVR